MWRRVFFSLLIALLTASAILSCAEIPRSGKGDWSDQQHQDQLLQYRILEQSG
jgi:hypothetical protein